MKPGEFGIFQLISLPNQTEGSQLGTNSVSSVVSSNTSHRERSHKSCDPSPQNELKLSFWVADEGSFYAPALLQHLQVDLQTAVFAKTQNVQQTWSYALEALQTGLFENVILRASEGCRPALLRKMQLVAENLRCRTFILCKQALPHWFFRASYPLTSLNQFLQSHEKIPLPTKPSCAPKPSRGLFEFDAESKRLRA